jgi:ankyrin repeat protein
MVQAAWLNDVPVLQRLLDAGADVNAPADLPPLHAACWTGQLAAAKLLVERCASLSARSVHGGTPLGTALHGSEHCHEPLGGPAMKLREEITHGQYAKIVDLLLEAGATLPDFADGSDAVQEVLRRWGAPDRD